MSGRSLSPTPPGGLRLRRTRSVLKPTRPGRASVGRPLPIAERRARHPRPTPAPHRNASRAPARALPQLSLPRSTLQLSLRSSCLYRHFGWLLRRKLADLVEWRLMAASTRSNPAAVRSICPRDLYETLMTFAFQVCPSTVSASSIRSSIIMHERAGFPSNSDE
jgi:hypothetical protein